MHRYYDDEDYDVTADIIAVTPIFDDFVDEFPYLIPEIYKFCGKHEKIETFSKNGKDYLILIGKEWDKKEGYAVKQIINFLQKSDERVEKFFKKYVESRLDDEYTLYLSDFTFDPYSDCILLGWAEEREDIYFELKEVDGYIDKGDYKKVIEITKQ